MQHIRLKKDGFSSCCHGCSRSRTPGRRTPGSLHCRIPGDGYCLPPSVFHNHGSVRRPARRSYIQTAGGTSFRLSPRSTACTSLNPTCPARSIYIMASRSEYIPRKRTKLAGLPPACPCQTGIAGSPAGAFLTIPFHHKMMKQFLNGVGAGRIKECVVCGESFQTNRPKHITCGKKCSRARKTEIKLKLNRLHRYGGFSVPEKPEMECDTCGKKFVPARPMHVSCSTECAGIRSRVNIRERSRAITKMCSPKRHLAKRECAVCGKKFQPKRVTQVACGVECAKERSRAAQKKYRINPNGANLAKRECAVCGKKFQPKSVLHVTCSPACSKIRRSNITRDRVRKFMACAPVEERECVWCHGMFKPRSAIQIVCCKECRHDRIVHKAKEWFRTHYGLRPLREVKCGWCGDQFQTNHAYMMYCGKECRSKASQAKRKGRRKSGN